MDIIITMPHLPKQGEDINIEAPLLRLGGCAYNVFETLRFLESPAILFSATGSGFYGHMVKERLKERGIQPMVELEEENGCCYCLVDEGGERSFLSYHGAEYIFYKSWTKNLDFSSIDSVYISGIDVEGPTGSEIVAFIYEHPGMTFYFAPGPRIMEIHPSRMKKILEYRNSERKGPVLHLNKTEAFDFTGKTNIKDAAQYLADRTNNILIITLKEQGCYCYDRENKKPGEHIPGVRTNVIDTTGAGDAHCGAIIAELKNGKPLPEACKTANKIGAAITGMHGAVFNKNAKLP